MPQGSEICKTCGKKKSPEGVRSVTQWLLDANSCDCERLKIEDASIKEVEICPTCGLRVPGRSGSMTQWIFSVSTCKCQIDGLSALQVANQEALGGTSTGTTGNVTSDSADDVSINEAEELTLDPANFPVSRYKAYKIIGTGGAGSVYLCRDRILNKVLAVKILHQLNAEQLIQFQTEARANSKLNHPSIVSLLDFGPTESGAPYMVLEYFNGITLAQYLERGGPLPLSEFIHIFEKIASALAFAHSLAIYHRDIKPSNILVSKRRNNEPPDVRLIDFGVAEMKRQTVPSITIEGHNLAGTPAYMAPDAFLGHPYNARSEIYSLGCVMFESLTNTVPFSDPNALKLLGKHAHEEPPKLSERSHRIFPPELERLMSQCLAKDPQERFGSMERLRWQILQLPAKEELAESRSLTRVENKRLSKKKAVGLISSVVLIAVAGTYFVTSRCHLRIVQYTKCT